MECPTRPRRIGVTIFMCLIVKAWSLPADVQSSRFSPPIGDTIQQLTSQLMNVNASSDITLDVRTPPKIKQQQRNRLMQQQQIIEKSHPGVAIPVDEGSIELENTTKKQNYYKIERSTTNSGLSTWILLSGHATSTQRPNDKKATIKQVVVNTSISTNKNDSNSNRPHIERIKLITTTSATNEPTTTEEANKMSKPIKLNKISTKNVENETINKSNHTLIGEKPLRTIINHNKPMFKKRNSTTTGTSTTTEKVTISTTATVKSVTPAPKNSNRPTKLNKLKASILNNAISKKNNNKKQTTTTTTTLLPELSTNKDNKTSEIIKNKISINNSTNKDNKTSDIIKNKIFTNNSTDSSNLPVEAKDGEVELPNNSDKKKKTNNKRKKNKNRRRKPEKSDAVTDLTNLGKPIGTQLYNYLSREIMPTVGVGLAGLMVAAGLASYFFYPFGALRRNYVVDRKDKEGGYYYHDSYSNGMLEEEAIGKVIAGMTTESLYSSTSTTNSYKHPSKKVYPNNNINNIRYRHVDHSTESYSYNANANNVIHSNIPESQNTISNYVGDHYIVGSVVDDSTPISVPEHGPRSLHNEETTEQRFVVGNVPQHFLINDSKSRKKRAVLPDDSENEIDTNNFDETSTANEQTTGTTEKISTSTEPAKKEGSFLDTIRDLIRFKVRFGLELVQNVTRSVSSYISRVQMRLDEHYRKKNA